MYEFDDDDADTGVDYEEDFDRAHVCDAHDHCPHCVEEGCEYCCACGEPLLVD